IFSPLLVWDHDSVLFQCDGLWGNSCRYCRDKFPTYHPAAGMGRLLEFTADRGGASCPGTRPLPLNSRELSDYPASLARRDLFLDWLDHRDKTVPVLRCEVRSL